MMNHILLCPLIVICTLVLALSTSCSQSTQNMPSAESTKAQWTPQHTGIRISSKAQVRSFQPSKSPWLAVGLSAVVPGTGQFYNRNYWKIPIIWGLGGYWISQWIDLNKSYKSLRDRYQGSVTENPPFGNRSLLELRNFYRDERDKFAWYLGALYFLNLIDAYVGAHLYDFEVTPDLACNRPFDPRITASVRISF